MTSGNSTFPSFMWETGKIDIYHVSLKEAYDRLNKRIILN